MSSINLTFKTNHVKWGQCGDEEGSANCSAHWISIVIPTKNRLNDLRLLISAILPQLAGEDEIIIVDNGSTDQTRGFLQQVARDAPCIRIFVDETPNLSAILNRAIDTARNDTIALFNDDCVPAPTWIESVRKHLSMLPDAAILGGAVNDRYDRRLVQTVKGFDVFWRAYDALMMNGDLLKFGVIKEWGSFSVSKTHPPCAQAVTCLSAANMVVSKRILKLSGSFDEDLRFNHFDGLLFIWSRSFIGHYPILSVVCISNRRSFPNNPKHQ